MMPQPQIHFIYDQYKEPDASFAAGLINELGQIELEEASDVVAISGDGGLLHAAHCSAGKRLTGILPPESNSTGFWMNKGITNAAELLVVLEHSQAYPIKPLQADITFADGSGVTRYGYNDVTIRPVHQMPTEGLKKRFNLFDIDVSVQSVLLNLRVSFANAVIGPSRVMGSGLIFATPFGSTAMNRNFGGPAIDIRNGGIVLTNMGKGYSAKDLAPVNNSADTVFHVEIQSQDKRPAMVTFDSFGVVRNENNSPIREVRVSTAQKGTVNLVLADDPGLRAYSAMMP